MQTKGQIALLLNLGEHNSRPQRMHRTSRHKNTVASRYRNDVQQVLKITATKSPTQLFSRNSGTQSRRDSTAGVCLQNDPRFRFSYKDGLC